MFVLSVAKIVKFAALHIDDPTVLGLAEAFEQDTGADHVKITVTAFPNGFAYRLEVEQGALKALAQVLPKMFQQAAGVFDLPAPRRPTQHNALTQQGEPRCAP